MSGFEIAGLVMIAAGSITFATAGLGVLRFPDVYTRASAVSTAAGLGVSFIVVGALLMEPTITTTVKAIVVVILQLATAAIGSMTIARAAYITGVPLRRKYFDELAERDEES